MGISSDKPPVLAGAGNRSFAHVMGVEWHVDRSFYSHHYRLYRWKFAKCSNSCSRWYRLFSISSLAALISA
jgi:hypothetical protein